MNLRVLLLSSLFLTAALAFAPAASAAPCSALGPYDVQCDTSVGNCDVEAGQTVGKAHTSHASADCRMGNMTRCYVGVGFVGSVANPSVDRWCAF